MFKKSYVLFALFLAAALFLGSCTRSAGQSTLPTQTSNATRAIGGENEPTSTGLSVIGQYGTQTVLAQGITPGAAQATETPNPAASGTPNIFTIVPPTGQAVTPGATTAVATTAVATTAVSTSSVVVPTATPGRPTTYTLQQGEYAYCLARRFNVDPQDLLDANGITGSQLLQPGLVLNIPQTGSFPGTRALHPHPASYTVMAGDTIYKVACYYGDLDPSSIVIANGLTSPYTLTAGRVLSIP